MNKRTGRWRRSGALRRLAALALAAVALARPAMAQAPYDHVYCEILATLAHEMGELRGEGLSQQEAATRIAERISEAVNASNRPLTERQVVARRLGAASTRILSFVYTLPMSPTREAFPFEVGVSVYGACAAGDL